MEVPNHRNFHQKKNLFEAVANPNLASLPESMFLYSFLAELPSQWVPDA